MSKLKILALIAEPMRENLRKFPITSSMKTVIFTGMDKCLFCQKEE